MVKQKSGVSVYDAQVAQAREWIGDDFLGESIRELKIFEVKGNVGGGLQLEGEAKRNDTESKTLRLPQSREEAKNIVDRFENTAKLELGNFRVSDNVGQHAMKVPDTLLEDEEWFGNEQEELDWYAHVFLHHLPIDPVEYQLCLGDAVHPLQTDDCR